MKKKSTMKNDFPPAGRRKQPGYREHSKDLLMRLTQYSATKQRDSCQKEKCGKLFTAHRKYLS